MKICIIDDEADCYFLARKLIEKLMTNSDFLHFINGQEAIDYITKQRSELLSLPELIFLNINMPVVNGWRFLKINAAQSADQGLSSRNLYMQFFAGHIRYFHGVDVCNKRLSFQAAYT